MATVATRDGAIWGYGRWGCRGGRAVLVHHGLVGDGALGPIWNQLGEMAGLEWIVIERPGYGQTPPMAMERLADWPVMVAPVLEALEIPGRFDAVGISAGGPYAYALAAGMPARVGRLCILAGVPFIGAPGVLDCYTDQGRAAYARYASAGEAALRAEFRTFCADATARVGGNQQVAAALAAILSHDAAGPAREARLQARDWGFDRSAVSCPVDLWHAEADDMVPFAAARLSAAGLTQASWHTQVEPTHLASEASLTEMTGILAAAAT